MRAPIRRFFLASISAAILVFSMAGLASANIDSKSILTEAGECIESGTPECSAAALYGPDGFSGQIFFDAEEIGTEVTLYDYICVHTTAEGPFVSYAGTYQFALSEGGLPLGSSEEEVDGDVPCTDGFNAVTSGSVTITVPDDGSVDYTISIDGIVSGESAFDAFKSYNSILNRVVEEGANQANSQSVGPPTTFIIPEAPLAALLVLTAGIGAVWFVSRRMRLAGQPGSLA